jgi:aminopeptidase N
MNFDWDKKRATGKAHYKIKVLQNTDKISFRCERLKVLKVEGVGMGKLQFVLDTLQHLLTLQTDKLLQNGKTYSLSIQYETTQHNPSQPEFLGGSFGRGIRFIQPDPLQPWIRKQLWTQSEATAYATWFPGPVVFSDVFTASFSISAPSELTVVAPGTRKEETKAGANKIHYFVSDKPVLPYLMAIVIGDYQPIHQQYKSTAITSYVYPDEIEAAKATMVRLSEMMAFLEQETGTSFPLKNYNQVVVQDYPFPGLTGQHGMALLSDNAIDDYGTHKDYQYLWDGVIFHALASQWLGNTIYPATPSDAWITKGLCQYLEGKFTTKVHGAAEYHLWYHPWEISNLSDTVDSCPLYSEQVLGQDGFFNESLTTYKAAGIWRMLELEIGAKGIQQFLNLLLSNHQIRAIQTSDVLQLIESIAGRDMDWFFNQWVYGYAIPSFEVIEKFNPGQQLLTLQIKQAAANHPGSPSDFSGKVRVSLGEKDTILLLAPQALNEYSIKMEAAPAWIRVDPLQEWWGHWKYASPTDALFNEATSSPYSWNKGKAINELLNNKSVSNWEKIIHPAVLKILEDNIQQPGYWRWKMNCLNLYARTAAPPYGAHFQKILAQLCNTELAPWVKATAINLLGNTRDSSYAQLYISKFQDTSDRVVSAAAIALGKTGSTLAYPALMRLRFRPSWKSQSWMHCMNGLAQLKDPRGIPLCLAALEDQQAPRWLLGNGWDFPVVAAQTLAVLGGGSQAYPILSERLLHHLEKKNATGVVYTLMLLTLMSPPEMQELFPLLKMRLQATPALLKVVKEYEAAFNEQTK